MPWSSRTDAPLATISAVATDEAVTVVEQTPDEIERLLDAGEWLRSGQIAVLLGMSRSTVHRLMGAGTIRHRLTPGGQRLGDPANVRQLLDDSRRIHGGAE